MKRYLKLILVTLVLASGMVAGCGQESRPTVTLATSEAPATRTQDEVCALVYNYLENKVSLVSAVPYRMDLLDTLGKARPYFQAVYQGNGKWQVSAIGYGVDINLEEYKKNFSPDEILEIEAVSVAEREQWVKSHEQWFLEQHFPSNPSWVKTGVHKVYYYRGGLWNLYEVSGAIEPANSEASELLLYIQWWTK